MNNTPERQIKTLTDAARQLQKKLPVGSPTFSLSIGWANTYDDIFDGEVKTLPETSIIDQARKRGRALIVGRGGSGKTLLLHRLMGQALKRRMLPIMIDLKNWTGADYERWAEWIKNPSIAATFLLERFGLPQVSALQLDWVPPSVDKLLLVDGLNEISAPVGQQILRAFNDFITESIRCSLIVADRLIRRDLPSPERWQIGLVQPLSRNKIQQYGGAKLLKSRSASLLDLPFFLDEAIKTGGVSEGRAATHQKFFAKYSGLTEQELDRVARTAFQAYMDNRTRTFAYEAFVAVLGSDIVSRLENNRILLRVGEAAYFSHHLQHDYLAARYLAGAGPEYWSPLNLDVISFRASSFDSVALVFEQINPDQADLFLRRVFDWNLYAAGYTLAEADPAKLSLSREMQAVILAMLAEKKFDLVEATRRRASDALALIRLPFADRFRKANALQNVFTAVGGVNSDEEWFNGWREAYSKPADATVSDHEIASVADQDSILGWTFANVMKRVRVTAEQLERLRSMLDGAGETVRWRLAHVLGAYPTSENLDVLVDLIRHDPDGLVRYGAARSLAELAARADADLRSRVIEIVKTNAPVFLQKDNERVLKEFADALIIAPEQAPEDWEQTVTEIAREFYLRCEPIEVRDYWRQYVLNAEVKYQRKPN